MSKEDIGATPPQTAAIADAPDDLLDRLAKDASWLEARGISISSIRQARLYIKELEGSANTRLIAADRDLLGALNDARQFVYDNSEVWYRRGQELLARIDAAIAKATGAERVAQRAASAGGVSSKESSHD